MLQHSYFTIRQAPLCGGVLASYYYIVFIIILSFIAVVVVVVVVVVVLVTTTSYNCIVTIDNIHCIIVSMSK